VDNKVDTAGQYGSPEELRLFVDSITVYTYIVDAETDEILMVNDHYAKNLGVDSHFMEGRKCWEYVDGERRCDFCPRFLDGDAPGRQDPGGNSVEGFDPTLGIWGRWNSQEIPWIDGRPANFITLVDISGEMMLRKELTDLAYYDRDLMLPNRAKFEKDIGERSDDSFSIIAFDYISLKYINDAYGRQPVNDLIKKVVDWIRGFALRNCEIYRVEGDNFYILFEKADMMSVSGLADRMYERFNEPWAIKAGDETFNISCRLSICVLDGRIGYRDVDDLFTIIDRTLEISKATRAVSVYDRVMDASLKRERELEMSLKNCVHDDMKGFDVYFQPIVDSTSKKWVGLEALARWDSPEFGRIPPLVFIRIAEKLGLINKVGQWVLERSIQICAELRLDHFEGFFLDVNLSMSQLSDEALISKVLVALQKHKFPAGCLSLEVTESEEFIETDYSQTTIERLKSLEIRIALDDFGTGYSNFNNLRNLPVGILKTEKAFIDNITTDEYQQFLSRIIAEMAHAAGMKLVAEGVETTDQLFQLSKNGTDYYQGYLFAKPLTKDELAKNRRKFEKPDPLFEEAGVG
jgi:EAL domain-containing protein (putative c-di-GMP-specific phosphodiesterase class I)/GGDEF domain-containing protein